MPQIFLAQFPWALPEQHRERINFRVICWSELSRVFWIEVRARHRWIEPKWCQWRVHRSPRKRACRKYLTYLPYLRPLVRASVNTSMALHIVVFPFSLLRAQFTDFDRNYLLLRMKPLPSYVENETAVCPTKTLRHQVFKVRDVSRIIYSHRTIWSRYPGVCLFRCVCE